MKKLKKISIIIVLILGILFINNKINAQTTYREVSTNYTVYNYLVKEEIIACLVFWSILATLAIKISGKKINLMGYYFVATIIVGFGLVYDMILTKSYTGAITHIDRFFYVFLLTGVVFGAAFENKNAKIWTVLMLTGIAGILQITGHSSENMWIEYAIYVTSQIIFLPQYVGIKETQSESKIQKARKILIEVGDSVNLKSIEE